MNQIAHLLVPSTKVQGLKNVGNSCFLNSVVQALASLEPFLAYISWCKNYTKENKGFVYLLWQTLEDVTKATSSSAIVPKIVKDDYVKELFLKYKAQHDASEFITYLFTWLEKEISQSRTVLSPSKILTTSDEKTSSNKLLLSPNNTAPLLLSRSKMVKNNSQIQQSTQSFSNELFSGNPFCGLMESKVKCQHCGFVSTNYSEFLEITLPIVWNGLKTKSLNLNQCMDKYTEEEPVEWKCSDCKSSQSGLKNSIKQLTIARHPKILCLHLNRIIQEFGMKKIDKHVTFEKNIDLFPYSSFKKGIFAAQTNGAKNDLITYELVAVIVHMGNAVGGHYIIYKKIPTFQNKWTLISDSTSREVSEEEVFKQQAYLLFYQRIEGK